MPVKRRTVVAGAAMGVTVPTLEECRALEVRVSASEAGAQPQPSEPTPEPAEPPPPPLGEGVQAMRIADLIELFGVNTFSSLDADANLWGSYPSDHTPASVIDALRWITGDSWFTLCIREYHYAGRADMQRECLHQAVGALPGTRVTMCVGANGLTADVPTMLALRDDATCAASDTLVGRKGHHAFVKRLRRIAGGLERPLQANWESFRIEETEHEEFQGFVPRSQRGSA